MERDYLITKNPLFALTVFFLPIMAGNLFQQCYNLVDSAVVGRFVSEQALAAVGACLALVNVFIFIANGGGVGAAVIVGLHFGEQDFKKLKTAVFTSFIAFLILSFVLGLVGLIFGRAFMIALQVPADILDMSVVYLRIWFLGLPFLFMYNVISALFNALGKSKFPLFFLIFSSVLNVFLDLLFVIKFKAGIAGVAWATLISQGISSVLSFCFFMITLKKISKGEDEGYNSENVPSKIQIFSFSELGAIVKVALPSIFQQSTISIGLLLIQSVVNSFGSQALAGFSVGFRIEQLGSVAMVATGTALSTFVAQNLGAGKFKRISSGYLASNFLSLISGLLFFIFVRIFMNPIISLFLGDAISETARVTAVKYLNYMSIVLSILGFKQNSDGVLRGSSRMLAFTIANVVNITLRVVFPHIFVPYLGIDAVWIASPVGWIASILICYIDYKIYYRKLLRKS